jgi:hypothetical protein
MTTPNRKKYADDDESTVKNALTTGRNRKLCFSLESNQSFPIPHIDDMNDEEVDAIWWEDEVYDATNSEVLLLVQKLIKGEKIEENNDQTSRGLENLTQLAFNHRRVAVTVVLNEQERQRDEGVQNDERLAEVYRNVSSHVQEAAYALALKDEAGLKNELEQKRTRPKSRGINSFLKKFSLRRRPVPEVMGVHNTRVMGQAA